MNRGRHSEQRPKVIIVGAGFGGFQAAQSVAESDADVLLIDSNNYTTFVPLLYQVATGQLEPALVACPIRNKLRRMKHVTFLRGTVERIDLNSKCIEASFGVLTYDYLVIATGTKPRYHGVSGAKEYTFTLKTLADAIALRNHILRCFEQALLTDDLQQRQQLLTFVVVGGGATGVEVAGALAELLRGACRRDFSELSELGTIYLVQSGSGLLPEFSQRLGNYTHRHLERLGVSVRLNTRITQVDAGFMTLSDGSIINTNTGIWTAGLEAVPPDLAQSVTTAKQGKLSVRDTLQLIDHPNVYAIGDVAYVEQDDKPLSGVAPEALQQGVAVARNLRHQLRGQSPIAFHYWNKGRLAIIGGYGGVGRIAGVNFGGPLAWAMWLSVHLVYLPGYRSRLVVLLTWMQNYVLGDRPVRQIM